ncbi:beta-1,3-glucosyltransferase [Athalia rosae]|uniref:beta-1,3-glucosyltransferase n=1 Tax=Athalia rosae TaxID=37344 RepID=UPI002033720C|nr:beta-1,3-glucosyltransferase [Athalia rosae]
MNFFSAIAVFAFCTSDIICTNGPQDSNKLTITVLSQPAGYHAARAHRLKNHLLEQAEDLKDVIIDIILTHELNFSESWTIGPFLPYLLDNSANSNWYFFCEVGTVIRLNLLVELLNGFNSSQDVWIGHALYDHEPTIIHHFSEHTKKFKYPNSVSGYAISLPLVQRLSARIVRDEKPDGEFSIDAAHEFAIFVWDEGRGKRMLHAPELCVVSGDDCATYPQHFHPCGKSVPVERVYVAIKTCSKFHTDRVSVIKKTWAKYAVNIGYYSDLQDENLPEAILTPNTKRGHCAKTLSILKHSNDVLLSKKLDWLLITDDDTILSLGRLLRLLTCYNPAESVALGERYGFRLWEGDGYNYLTGGAGLVLSTRLVSKLIEPGFCSCPSASTPDDMFLFGVCLKRAGVQPTHLPFFHQARPADYPRPYLASHEPISFHKFWLVDPEQVYKDWFAEADVSLSHPIPHTEL